MYTTGNRSLEMDLRQDWNLIAAWEESGGVTHLSISRLLETCDDNDHKITVKSIQLSMECVYI